jgi:predicted nuclease of predicted toxin-antitoxin system
VRAKLDENLPRAARALLEGLGWDVHDVHVEGLSGVADAVIRDACERESRILITLDTDFADVRGLHQATSPGVILLRPRDQSIQATLACLRGALRLLAVESPHGALWVVDAERVRVRRGA